MFQITRNFFMMRQQTPTHPKKSNQTLQRTGTTSLDIPQIMEDSQSSINFAKKMDGKNIVVLLGNTGVGKTTTIHCMVGSQLWLNSKTLTIDGRFPEIVKDFVIGKEVISETK